MITHKQAAINTKQWLESNDFRPTKLNHNHLTPDLTYLDSNNSVCIYEIKPEPTYHDDIRRGIIQCLEWLLLGYKSYLVIPKSYLPEVQLLIPHIPGIGVIVYVQDKLEIFQESETIISPISINLFCKIMDERPNRISVKTSHSNPKRRTRVVSYTMKRKGKLIHVKSFLRKRHRNRNKL